MNLPAINELPDEIREALKLSMDLMIAAKRWEKLAYTSIETTGDDDPVDEINWLAKQLAEAAVIRWLERIVATQKERGAR